MRYFHDVRRTSHVCPSVRTIQFENRWADLDDIWYGRYAIWVKQYFQISCSRL
jgi:hypothetical protein